MNIIKDLSPNFTLAKDSVSQYGEPRTFKYIVLHWWGDPKDKPTFDGTVNYLKKKSSQVSAHYVVSDTKITQLVEEENIAWHSRQANPSSIGIEIDPQFPGKTLETVAELVEDICNRRNIKVDESHIKGHSFFVATACPGTLNIPNIIEMIVGEDCKKKIEELNDKLIKALKERQEKDDKYEEAKEELVKLAKSSKENYEALQNTLAEVNQINSSLMTDKKSLKDDIEILKEKEEKLDLRIEELKKLTIALEVEKDDLRAKLELINTKYTALQLDAKKKLKGYSKWSRFLSLFS